jgi:hypothetical protein
MLRAFAKMHMRQGGDLRPEFVDSHTNTLLEFDH